MKVKIFDKTHEEDLERAINNFIDTDSINVLNIKYQVSTMFDGRNQIYCYSAMILYNN